MTCFSTLRPTPARVLFERLAVKTWQKIPLGHVVRCRHLETTFNDDHTFEIAIAKIPGVRVYKAVGRDESKKGFDWEWWIGRPGHFWRYSVQAKLHAYAVDRYLSLRHSVQGRLQIDILDSFSRSQGSIPLYCFYNSVTWPEAKTAWHCSLPLVPEQLGCTLVPLDAVRPYVQKWKVRSFTNLHTDTRALPWRCIVTCPNIVTLGKNPLAPPDRRIMPHRRLPAFAQIEQGDEGGIIEVELPDEFYRSDLGGYPRAVAVVTLPEEIVGKENLRHEITE
jgi:hypothetical protein